MSTDNWHFDRMLRVLSRFFLFSTFLPRSLSLACSHFRGMFSFVSGVGRGFRELRDHSTFINSPRRAKGETLRKPKRRVPIILSELSPLLRGISRFLLERTMIRDSRSSYDSESECNIETMSPFSSYTFVIQRPGCLFTRTTGSASGRLILYLHYWFSGNWRFFDVSREIFMTWGKENFYEALMRDWKSYCWSECQASRKEILHSRVEVENLIGN